MFAEWKFLNFHPLPDISLWQKRPWGRVSLNFGLSHQNRINYPFAQSVLKKPLAWPRNRKIDTTLGLGSLREGKKPPPE